MLLYSIGDKSCFFLPVHLTILNLFFCSLCVEARLKKQQRELALANSLSRYIARGADVPKTRRKVEKEVTFVNDRGYLETRMELVDADDEEEAALEEAERAKEAQKEKERLEREKERAKKKVEEELSSGKGATGKKKKEAPTASRSIFSYFTKS